MKTKKILTLLIICSLLLTTGCNQTQNTLKNNTQSVQNETFSVDNTLPAQNEIPSTNTVLAGTTWYCAQRNYGDYEINFEENGVFISNYYDEYIECSMSEYNYYSYDKENGIITLRKNDANDSESTELKIHHLTKNSIFFSDEESNMHYYVTKDTLSECPKLEYIHSSILNGSEDIPLNIIDINDNKLYAKDIGCDESTDSDLFSYDVSDDTYYYLLEIDKYNNSEEVTDGFKYVRLTKEGAETIISKGPCKALVSIWDCNKINCILFYTETQLDGELDYANLFRYNSSGTISNIIATDWYLLGSQEELLFTDDGEFYFSYDGEPVGGSDCYPHYEYNKETGIIKVFDESIEDSSIIKIVEHTSDKLVLQMENEILGGTYTFVTQNNIITPPDIVVSETSYSAKIPIRIEAINENTITAKGTFDFRDDGDISKDFTITDNTKYFIMKKITDETYDPQYRNLNYIQLTKQGAQKLLSESPCRAYVDVDENSTIPLIVFSPAWQAIEGN